MITILIIPSWQIVLSLWSGWGAPRREPARADPLHYFNLGEIELGEDSSGLNSASDKKRCHLIEINSSIKDGQLQMEWNYSQGIDEKEAVSLREHFVSANLANSFIDMLQQIITHCQSDSAGGYTPSDFALAELDRDNLDRILDMVDFGDI